MSNAENNEDLKNALKAYGLREEIGRIRKEMLDEKSRTTRVQAPVRPLFGRVMKVAAAVLLLIVGTGAFVYIDSTPENLFRNKYQPYEESVPRGEPSGSSEIKTRFLQGQEFLQTGDPDKAILVFSGILHANSQRTDKVLNDDAEYYLALAYLQADQPDNALPLLEKIHTTPSHLYNDQVTTWFLLKVRISAWKQ